MDFTRPAYRTWIPSASPTIAYMNRFAYPWISASREEVRVIRMRFVHLTPDLLGGMQVEPDEIQTPRGRGGFTQTGNKRRSLVGGPFSREREIELAALPGGTLDPDAASM